MKHYNEIVVEITLVKNTTIYLCWEFSMVFKCNTLFCFFPLFTQDEFSNNVHVCYKRLERSEAKETKILQEHI